MNKGAWLLIVGILALAGGCTSTQRIVGHEGVHVGDWYGDLGITGNVNEVTVKRGSRLDKLSILGDMNKVFIEERVVLGKIEVWGENNEVSIPERLIVRDYRVGKGNKIVRRVPGGTIELRSPDAEVLEGQQPNTPAHSAAPRAGEPGSTPPGNAEILEVQPAEPRKQLPPGVHNPENSSNPQNPPKRPGE